MTPSAGSGSRTPIAWLEARSRAIGPIPRSAGGRRGSRTLKAHRSTVFETAAIAHWLALPLLAAVTGIEPVSVRLTGACPYQHGPHRNGVGRSPSRRSWIRTNDLRFPKPAELPNFPIRRYKSAQRDSNPRIRHGKAVGCRYIMGALCRFNCQRTKSTGSDSNRRRRITGAESWPLDDQCFVVSGTGGIRTLTCLVKSQVCGQ
jgi:hypothetical protein